MPLTKFIAGYGYVESFEQFVDCCHQLARIQRKSMDLVVMEILGGYYPSLHKAITDSHGGLPNYPGKLAPYGKQKSYTSLDAHVFPYLQGHWE